MTTTPALLAYLERAIPLNALPDALTLIANQAICQELALALYYGHVFGRLVEVYRP